MAEISVERKSGVPWWLWLIGLLLIVACLWFWLGRDDRNRVVGVSTPEATEVTAVSSAAPDAAITDPAIYASTVDKASLAGQEASFNGAKVVRIVGPKTFMIASGSDELFVMIDEDLSSGVSSQGRIDIGDSVDLIGIFQRLEPDTINDISDRRFRTLTELERETLSKTQVYLHVTEVGRLN